MTRLVEQAEQHRGEDEALRNKVELRNRADAMAYQSEKTLREAEGIDEPTRETVEARIKALREAVEADDADRMQSGLSELEQAMHELSSKLYAAQQAAEAAAAGDGAAEPADAAPDDVVEGEFREA